MEIWPLEILNENDNAAEVVFTSVSGSITEDEARDGDCSVQNMITIREKMGKSYAL